MWANYHTHSNFCDGKSTFIEHIESAKKLNITFLGFSSHAPVPFDCKWCMRPTDLEEYLSAINALKQNQTSIEVYAGLEVDFVPRVVSPAQFSTRLDYTIGSIHFVDSFPDGKLWEIDGLHTIFQDGLEKIFKNDFRAAFTRYFELTREMIQTACPTIIGHLDKIKIQNPKNKYFKETENWYQDQIKETIEEIKKTGAIVEVNTRGIYQKKTTDPYPSPWILEMLQKATIPITLSSDAHHADDLVNQFSSTAKLLTDIGFKKIHILNEGDWKPFTFNEKGIIL